MKRRILTLIGGGFALLLFSRAATVSSTVIKNQSDTEMQQSQLTAQNSPLVSRESDLLGSDGTTSTDPQKQCLTAEVADLLQEDMKRLEQRKGDIQEREAILGALEDRLAQQLSDVEVANAELESRIKFLKDNANEDISHLVKMYETMKAKQAAEIFNSMAPAFAAGFLREMNSTKAGLIMASMEPKKSYAISIIIAGRNASYRE